MAEIDRPDLISDEAFRAPYELAKGLGAVEEVLDDIIAKGGAHSTIIQSAKSTKDLAKASIELEQQQKKLQDAQKKVVDSTKKSTQSIDKNKESMDALDKSTGGVISRFKDMGKQMLALMKNPFIAMLAILVVTLAAITSAVKTFLTTTGEGEDILNRQKAVWNQFFATLKKGWKDLGKSVVEAMGEDGLQGFLFTVLTFFSPKLAAMFAKNVEQAKDLADVIDDIDTRMAINIVKRAETERNYNRLALQAEESRYTNQVKSVELLERSLAEKQEQLNIDKELAKQHADAVLYSIGLEHSLDKATVDRMSHAERDAEFTGDQMKQIAEAYAEVIMLESKYEQEAKRNTAKIIAYKEQIRKDIVKEATAATEYEIAMAQRSVDLEISLVQDAAARREISVREAEDRISKIKEDAVVKQISFQIKAYTDLINLAELNAEEELVIREKLDALRVQLHDAYLSNTKDNDRLYVEDVIGIYEDFTSSLGGLLDTLTENRLANIDREEERLTKLYDKELELAGENAEAKEALEKRFANEQEKLERKRIEAKRKAAIFDKITSATQAGIATSLAIIKMLADPGGFAGAALSIAAGITGGLQVASILAKDIPQYEHGGKTIAETIIAGEKGHELYKTPSGNIGLTPDTATIMNLPKGTEIFSSPETMRMLALSRLAAPDSITAELDNDVSKYFKSLEHAIKNKKELHINFSRRGLEAAIHNAETRTKILNDLFR